jgi:hypothetical protein
MLELLLKLIEQLTKLVDIREKNRGEYFQRYVQPAYDTAEAIYGDYRSLLLKLREMVGQVANPEPLIIFLKERREELLPARDRLRALVARRVQEVCSVCGIDYDTAMGLKGTGKPAITESHSLALFHYMVNQLLSEIRRLIPGFDTFSENRQLGLMDVAWVGIGTLGQFHKMFAAINRSNWSTAAEELLNSELAMEWGRRAVEDAILLRNG